MKEKYVLMYHAVQNILHITNATEVYKNEKIKNDPDNYLIDVFEDITHSIRFQEQIKPEFMSERDFHKKGHLSCETRETTMKYSLLYDNEEYCFKVHISSPDLNDRYSLIANFDSEERCTIVGNILMDCADEKDISLQAAYMQFIDGQLHAEYKIKSIELTYQELKKEAAIKPTTGVIKIENPVMKYSVSIDIKFDDFANEDCKTPDVRDITNSVVFSEHHGYPLEGYSAKGAYYYIPNEMLKSAIVFVTKDA